MSAEARAASSVRAFPQSSASGVFSRAVITDVCSVPAGYLAAGSTLWRAIKELENMDPAPRCSECHSGGQMGTYVHAQGKEV